MKYLINSGYLDKVSKYSDNSLYYSGRFKDTLFTTDSAIVSTKKYANYHASFNDTGNISIMQLFAFKTLGINAISVPFVKKKGHLISIFFADSIHLENNWYYCRGVYDNILAAYDGSGSLEWAKQIGDTENDGFGSFDIDEYDNIIGTFGCGNSLLGDGVVYPKTYYNYIDSINFTATSYDNILFLKLNSSGKYISHKMAYSAQFKQSKKHAYMMVGLKATNTIIDSISVFDKTTGFTDGASAVFKMDTNFVAQYGFSISPMNQNLTGSTGVGFTNRLFSGDALGNSYFAGTYDKCGVNVSSPIATDAVLNPSKSWINNDIILVKYDSTGKLSYATSHGNDGAFDFVNSILPDDKGNLYVCGSYVEKIKFGTDSLTCSASNMFIAKLDPMGKPIWLKQCDGAPGAVNNLVILNDSSIAALCYLQQGSSFDGVVAAKSGYHIVYFNEVNYPTKISNVEVTSTNLYPNPAHTYFAIDERVENLQIFNLVGKNMVINTQQLHKSTKVQTSDLSDGIYFVKYQKNNTITTSKILIKH